MTDPSAAPPPGSFAVDDAVAAGTRSLLRCRGELDAATAPVLAEALDRLGTADVSLDLAEVSFMDSAGVQVIAGVTRRLSASGGSLDVRAVSPVVERVLVITGLDRLITR